MFNSSYFSAGAGKRMKGIALRIQSRMRRLNLSASQLSDVCSVVVSKLDENTDLPGLRRDRIAKILMNSKSLPEKAAAKAISDVELTILARALKCSAAWLSGKGLDEDPIVWNALTEPERGAHVLHLIEEYEERAGESTVWSEYPLCSFTTEEFMVAFHRAHFSEMDTAGITRDKQQLVDLFNRTGRVRRKRVLSRNRNFSFTSMIYESDLKRMAAGSGVYRSIGKEVRKATLNHAARVIEDPAFKMSLVIVDDQKAPRAKVAWRDHETVGVMGDLFSLWNYHSGLIGWSENSRYIKHQRDLIDEMKKHALCKDPHETIQYVKQLAAKL